ncbi:MAG: PfkB family carbohydrate kinase, partial [Treponema sp.]|nr:PfkB family carbohydrate kinase [Treponema sp.]
LTVCLNPTLQKTLRFSSIIPDTVNRTGIHRLDVSGKGINVSRVLSQLGKSVTHLTQLGGLTRSLFLSLCEEDSISVEWVESNSQIRFCHTLINDTDSSVTELVEESEPIGAGTEERLMEKFDNLLNGNKPVNNQQVFKYLIISGTKAAGFSGNVFPLMVKKAKEKGLKIILDVKGNDLTDSLQHKPDIIKPNLYEFASTFAPELVKNNDLTGDKTDTKEKIKTLMLDICKKYDCRIILTRGSRKVWAAGEGSFFEVAFQTVKPVNTTGSGDAFTAGFAAALGDGAGFSEAINEAIRCGALNAGLLKPGVTR